MRIYDNQRVAILLVVGLTCLNAACGKSDSSGALQKELKTVISWIETTRAVGEGFENGSVPSAYAARTFQTAQENLQQEIENIQSLSISEPTKANLTIKLEQLENTIGQAVQQ